MALPRFRPALAEEIVVDPYGGLQRARPIAEVPIPPLAADPAYAAHMLQRSAFTRCRQDREHELERLGPRRSSGHQAQVFLKLSADSAGPAGSPDRAEGHSTGATGRFC